MDDFKRRRQRTGFAVLDEYAVGQIKRRLMMGERPRDLALAYGVGPETIRRISRGETWAWVDAVGVGEDIAKAADASAQRLAEMLGLPSPTAILDKVVGEAQAELDTKQRVESDIDRLTKGDSK